LSSAVRVVFCASESPSLLCAPAICPSCWLSGQGRPRVPLTAIRCGGHRKASKQLRHGRQKVQRKIKPWLVNYAPAMSGSQCGPPSAKVSVQAAMAIIQT
jgi:hypothetical protein